MNKLFLSLVLISALDAYGYNLNTTVKDNKLLVNLDLDKNELLYSNSIDVSSQNPKIKFEQLKKDTKGELTSYTNPDTNRKQDAYKDKVSFTYNINNQDSSISQLEALISFKTNKSNIQEIVQLDLNSSNNKTQDKNAPENLNITNSNSSNIDNKNTSDKTSSNIISTVQGCIIRSTHYLKDNLTSMFKTTGSAWIRYLVTFIIGVLLSLTPCIYPMIPITVGIIQATGSTSFIRNFLVSLAYTLGVSLTFATFGFIAALGSCAFGQLQTSPWFIIPLATVLTYLGLSMFGLYDMYVPRFLQAKTAKVKKGSAISAFIFGAISGTVASPCLSPGLALVLSYVMEISKTGNIAGYLEGFSLLFIFGVGSSMPLLLVGTFSSSIKVLPKAGMWMVEIKRLLGLMLLGMVFYYLQAVLPLFLLLWILAIGLFTVGIYYFWDVKPYDSKYIRYYKNIMGLVFILIAFLVAIHAYKATYNYIYGKDKADSTKATPDKETDEKDLEKLGWNKNLEKAKELAQDQNKYLFIDFYGDFCSSCKELEENVLSKDKVEQVLSKYYIPLKVNISDNTNNAYNNLKDNIQVLGVPTIAIYNPQENKIIKQWTGADISVDNLVKELEQNHK